MSEFMTPNGKTIATFIDPGTALFRVKFTQGGELPAELSGYFTSAMVADRTVKCYLAKQTDQKKPSKGQ